MNMSRHATIRLFKPTGARKRMTPIITPCSMYSDIRILALSGPLLLSQRFPFFLCLSFSVTLRGFAASIFYAEYNLHSKFIRSKLINTTVRGYSLAFAQKNLHSSRWSVVFFCASAEHPFCSRRAAGSTSEQTSNSDYTH